MRQRRTWFYDRHKCFRDRRRCRYYHRSRKEKVQEACIRQRFAARVWSKDLQLKSATKIITKIWNKDLKQTCRAETGICDSKNILPNIRRHFLPIAANNSIGGFCKGPAVKTVFHHACQSAFDIHSAPGNWRFTFYIPGAVSCAVWFRNVPAVLPSGAASVDDSVEDDSTAAEHSLYIGLQCSVSSVEKKYWLKCHIGQFLFGRKDMPRLRSCLEKRDVKEME